MLSHVDGIYSFFSELGETLSVLHNLVWEPKYLWSKRSNKSLPSCLFKVRDVFESIVLQLQLTFNEARILCALFIKLNIIPNRWMLTCLGMFSLFYTYVTAKWGGICNSYFTFTFKRFLVSHLSSGIATLSCIYSNLLAK